MRGTVKQKPLLLGRYEIGRLLGEGNFAKVYQAKNSKTNEDVAIKVLDKEKIFKRGLAPQLKREIEVLRRVRHPYIVQLHEVMATKSKIYIVMEFVKGGELFNKVAKGRLPEDVARKYFQQLISAVAFCHVRGVYHRDIKPENLLVDENGDLKVADFGLSAVAEQIQQDGLFYTLCGTPAYVAPDVLARRGYDAGRADLWSCGVVLFVLMAGYPPFRDHHMIGLVRKIYRAEYRCPRWFSPDLIHLIRAILEPNPNKRITIQEIMQNHWFKIDFRQISFYVEGLFEEQGVETRFISCAPVSKIISKLEKTGNAVNFTVRIKDWQVSLDATTGGGDKGPLSISAEISELTPKLVLVEVKKKSGNADDYVNFCNKELKPRLSCLIFNGNYQENSGSETD
ncbi:CBL-interacting serine/threonine-protein kinase 12-like isoform X2 [Carex rostrata]